MSGYFKTIGDMERATYGMGSDNVLKSTGITSGIEGRHYSTGSSGDAQTTELYNIIFGQKVWSMINREMNALSMLPKKPWKSSGWRMLKSRAIGGANDTFSVSDADDLGGQPENQALSSITNVKPDYTTLTVTPKTVAHTFEISEIAQLMAGLDDGIGDLIANYREEVGITHAEVMNAMVLQDLTATAGKGLDHSGFSGVDDALTSLYKIIATFAETNAMSNYANKNDLYGQTRASSGTEYLEAFVDSNSGTDRNLTVNLLNTALRNLMARGGDPKVILTGYDTIQTLGELLQAQERFMGRT